MIVLRMLWRMLFCQRVPVVGERWVFDCGDDPFITTTVTVLEVKEKWVRYKFTIIESSLPLRKFVAMYVPENTETA